MPHNRPLLFRIAGPSNSGKTTYLMELIKRLKEHNLNVATIKHSHHKLDVVSRKDGHKLGALAPNLTVGQDRMILDEPLQTPPNLFELIDRFYSKMDVVLVESWRDESIPTLLIANPPTNWVVPEGVLARTTNVVSETFESLPVWEIDDVVDWVVNFSR
jgi:molybdopterin-guanine dinucleotide biosynthesis protein MobB